MSTGNDAVSACRCQRWFASRSSSLGGRERIEHEHVVRERARRRGDPGLGERALRIVARRVPQVQAHAGRRGRVHAGEDRVEPLLAEALAPMLDHPVRQRRARREIGLARRLGRHAPQHGVHEPGGALVPVLAREPDAFGHGGIRLDAVHRAQLIRPEPQDLGDRLRQRLRALADERLQLEVEKAPHLDRAVRELGRERAIARRELGLAQPVIERLARPARIRPEHVAAHLQRDLARGRRGRRAHRTAP